MLYFCTWKDEDGSHYGVTNKNPKKYFCWPQWWQCQPMVTNITSSICKKMLEVHPGCTIEDDFIEVEISNWNIYFDEVKPKLRFLR